MPGLSIVTIGKVGVLTSTLRGVNGGTCRGGNDEISSTRTCLPQLDNVVGGFNAVVWASPPV